MGITAYSTPPKLSEYKEPISEELMMKGTMMDAQRIEQADQEIQNTFSQLKGIPSLPGADEERKKQILSGIQEQVKGMSYNDLRNPSISNQIKGYIQQVANNPDLLAIGARGTKYNQDMTTYQALTAKGKQVSPWNMAGLNEAQEYINKNLFIRDKRFSNGVQEDPEINKAMMDAMKEVKEEESTTMSGGRYVTTKTRPLEKLNQVGLGLIANTPQINQDFQRKFEYSTKGTDWEGLGTEHYQQGIQAATSVINNPHSSAIDKQNAQRDLKEFQAALQSPTIGDLYKQEEYDKEIKNYVQNISLGLNSYGKVEKQTEVAIHSQNKALDYQYDQMKAMQDLQIESGLSPQAYVTPQGTFDKDAYITAAQQKIQQNVLDVAQGRQDIKTEGKTVEDDNAIKTIKNNINRLNNSMGFSPVSGEADVTSITKTNYKELNEFLKAKGKKVLAGDDDGGDVSNVSIDKDGKVLITGDFEGGTTEVTLEKKEFAEFLESLITESASSIGTQGVIEGVKESVKAAGTKRGPKLPATQEEYDALAPGEQYINAAGETVIKS